MSAVESGRVAGQALTVIRHGCPGCGMNVGFSSEDPMYNPSKAISGGWYNSEVMAYPAYGQPNLPVDSEYVKSPVLPGFPVFVSSEMLTLRLQQSEQMGPLRAGGLARHQEDRLRHRQVPRRRDQLRLRVPAGRYVAPSYLLVLRSTRLTGNLDRQHHRQLRQGQATHGPAHRLPQRPDPLLSVAWARPARGASGAWPKGIRLVTRMVFFGIGISKAITIVRSASNPLSASLSGTWNTSGRVTRCETFVMRRRRDHGPSKPASCFFGLCSCRELFLFRICWRALGCRAAPSSSTAGSLVGRTAVLACRAGCAVGTHSRFDFFVHIETMESKSWVSCTRCTRCTHAFRTQTSHDMSVPILHAMNEMRSCRSPCLPRGRVPPARHGGLHWRPPHFRPLPPLTQWRPCQVSQSRVGPGQGAKSVRVWRVEADPRDPHCCQGSCLV